MLVGDRDVHEGGTGSHREQSQYLAARLPNADLGELLLGVIAGTSHGLFWEKPEETVAAIREWAKSQSIPVLREPARA